jgi:hypothetical protein
MTAKTLRLVIPACREPCDFQNDPLSNCSGKVGQSEAERITICFVTSDLNRVTGVVVDAQI